jgi:hypothetical protein
MPLQTQIIRDGEVMKLKWGGFHVAAMVIAASADSGQGPYKDMSAFQKEIKDLMEKQDAVGVNPSDVWSLMDYGAISATPMGTGGEYELKERWVFHDNSDGEVLELLPGDILRAWRGH